MTSRLREKLDAIDLKSILLTTLILGTILLMVYKCSDPVENLSDSLTTKGKGKIILVTPNNQMKQGKKGTFIYTESYQVKFYYVVNGVTYEQTDVIKNIGRNQTIVDKINDIGTDSIEIIYNGIRPTESKIYLPKD